MSCTVDSCVNNNCSNVSAVYGDINVDGDPNLDDLVCMVDTLNGVGLSGCEGVDRYPDDLDIFPCSGDNDVNLFDLIFELNALSGDSSPCPDPCVNDRC